MNLLYIGTKVPIYQLFLGLRGEIEHLFKRAKNCAMSPLGNHKSNKNDENYIVLGKSEYLFLQISLFSIKGDKYASQNLALETYLYIYIETLIYLMITVIATSDPVAMGIK